MKAILEFDLVEEREEFDLAANGHRWSFSLWDLDQWLRAQMKYNDHNMTEEEYSAYEKCREKLHDVMQDHGVSFRD